MSPSTPIADRLSLFTAAGLIPVVPTAWQLHQGNLQMLPYVTSTDATAEDCYQGALFGHPLVRQPLIISRVGIDHFRTGAALGAALKSLIAHLHLTYHRGMPVFDLQIIQTHEGGLAALRARTEEFLDGQSRAAARHNRFVKLILPDAASYYRQFLGDDGWIARAERFDYDGPDTKDVRFPPEYFSLVSFANHCARSFPAHARDTPWRQMPGHLAGIVGRRFREGGRFGWFAGK